MDTARPPAHKTSAAATPAPFRYCGRGPCSAEAGHAGTCAEASGWDDETDFRTPTPPVNTPLLRTVAERIMLAAHTNGATLTPEQGLHLAEAALAGVTAAGHEIAPAIIDPDPEPTPPRDVRDVAEAILATTGTISSMKLQKYAYYAQAYCLAWTGQPMFEATIHAWARGPVIPELLEVHRNQVHIHPGDIGGDPGRVTDSDRSIIASIEDALGGLTGWQVATRIRTERPWMDAFDETDARHHRQITHEAMRTYYRDH